MNIKFLNSKILLRLKFNENNEKKTIIKKGSKYLW